MKHLLSSTAFLIVNKQLAALIGLNETVLLADLISKEEYFMRNNLNSKKCKTINKNKKIKTINKYFIKPMIHQIEFYCKERKNNIDAEAFFNFYESKGWKVGNTKMKDWKAAIVTWEKRDQKKPKTMSKIDSQINEYLKGKEYL